MRDNEVTIEVFGQDGARLCQLLDGVVPELQGTAIDWGQPAFETLRRQNPEEGYRQYWLEILGRAYVASAASLVRTWLWIHGVTESCRRGNYQPFAASLRGLVESAADSMYSLEPAAPTLAEQFGRIRSVLTGGGAKVIVACPELEEKLIHFAYARKTRRSDEVPAGHSALYARDYIDVLKRFSPRLETLYVSLCEVVHPASASVTWMLDIQPGAPWRIRFVGKARSAGEIQSLVQSYRCELLDLLKAAINYPLLTLKVLSYFQIESFSLDFMSRIDLSNLPVWGDIAGCLR